MLTGDHADGVGNRGGGGQARGRVGGGDVVVASRDGNQVEAVGVGGVAVAIVGVVDVDGANFDVRRARLPGLLNAVAVVVVPHGVADDGAAGDGLEDVAEVSVLVDFADGKGDGGAGVGLALAAQGVLEAVEVAVGVVGVADVDEVDAGADRDGTCSRRRRR